MGVLGFRVSQVSKILGVEGIELPNFASCNPEP